jgi:pyruvate dehydrogenase E2 component (dihydrolipoamide acetyltransferase)
MYGIERFNAILVPGQSAILAVGKIIKTPIVIEDNLIIVRPILSLTLTVDHRVLDGAQAAQFLNEIAQLLESPPWIE